LPIRLSISAGQPYFLQTRRSTSPDARVLDEIRNHDRKLVFFVDDRLPSTQEAAKSFLRDLIPMTIAGCRNLAGHDERPDLIDLLPERGLGNVQSILGFPNRSALRASSYEKGRPT